MSAMYVPVASFEAADSDLAGKRRPVDSIEIESARENQEREESGKCRHLLLREMPDPVNGTFLFR